MLIRKSRFWLRAGTKKVVRANYMYIVIIWIIVFIVTNFNLTTKITLTSLGVLDTTLCDKVCQ
jgi:hypothetical protein